MFTAFGMGRGGVAGRGEGVLKMKCLVFVEESARIGVVAQVIGEEELAVGWRVRRGEGVDL